MIFSHQITEGFKFTINPPRIEQDDESGIFFFYSFVLLNLKKNMDIIDFDIAFQRVYPGQNIKFFHQSMSREDLERGGFSDGSSYLEMLTRVA